jgi:hypothetical protein
MLDFPLSTPQTESNQQGWRQDIEDGYGIIDWDPTVGKPKVAEDFVVRCATTLHGEKFESVVEWKMDTGTQRMEF